MRTKWIAMTMVGASASMAIISCNWSDADCGMVGVQLLSVEVRDVAGRAQGAGSTVTVVTAGNRETVSMADDSIRARYFGSPGSAVVDVEVTKPHYQAAVIKGVKVGGNSCLASGNAPVTLPIVLTLAANAPAVRSVYLLPARVLLDRSPFKNSQTFAAVVDANPGKSTAVRWRLDGDPSGVTLDPQTGTVQYRCTNISTYPKLLAISMADSSVVGSAELAIQGHPAAVNDPPCG